MVTDYLESLTHLCHFRMIFNFIFSFIYLFLTKFQICRNSKFHILFNIMKSLTCPNILIDEKENGIFRNSHVRERDGNSQRNTDGQDYELHLRGNLDSLSAGWTVRQHGTHLPLQNNPNHLD